MEQLRAKLTTLAAELADLQERIGRSSRGQPLQWLPAITGGWRGSLEQSSMVNH